MDVFIPEEYVAKRKLEKKAKAAAAAASQKSRSRNNRAEATDNNKASSVPHNAFYLSNSQGFGHLVGDDYDVFIYFSA